MFKISEIKFGEVVINGEKIEEDFIVFNGKIEKRDKEKSRKLKPKYGHTPLTIEENIPWQSKRLIIGIGFYKSLPITKEFKEKASKRGIELIIVDTRKALKLLEENKDPETGFIIHLTC